MLLSLQRMFKINPFRKHSKGQNLQNNLIKWKRSIKQILGKQRPTDLQGQKKIFSSNKRNKRGEIQTQEVLINKIITMELIIKSWIEESFLIQIREQPLIIRTDKIQVMDIRIEMDKAAIILMMIISNITICSIIKITLVNKKYYNYNITFLFVICELIDQIFYIIFFLFNKSEL